jgi:ABC-type bacteriocin/lantibiotic exporter with double-glycine peptidase domain
MIPYERHRYACGMFPSHPSFITAKTHLAVKDHMKSKRTYEMSSQAISAAQGLVMTLGLLGALWLGVYQVAYDGKSVGKFTTLLVYWAQLQSKCIINP